MSGRNTRGRDAMGVGLAGVNKLAAAPGLDRLGLRAPLERLVYRGARSGFRAAGAVNRTFVAARTPATAQRPANAAERSLFDLTPDDEQAMIVAATREFAAEQLRPAAAVANDTSATSDTVVKRAVTELGVTQLAIPESLGGMGGERSATTGVLVAEALAHGDMGQAVAILAPSAVSTALVLWGDEHQQATYLPAFAGDDVPAAALAIAEPRPLFDPLELRTTATRTAGGLVLDGVKSLVPRAAEAELFLVAASLEGRPTLFLVESGSAGLTVEPEPAMGLRAASTGRLVLSGVTVAASAPLGGGADADYLNCIRLSRLAWSALALGTCQAVLDYVIPYVNERRAFGEPISNRQAVAFKVADIGIELEGARLATYRAASRADQGKPFAREVAIARRLSAEYGMRIGSDGVQLLGGHGYVKEHPVERWYRDLRAVAVMEGTVLV